MGAYPRDVRSPKVKAYTANDSLTLKMFFPSRALTYALLAFASALHMHAAELVTLRSGFTVTCTAHEVLSAETIRLHLPTENGSAQNYMDVAASSIATFEEAPDVTGVNSPPNAPALTASAAMLQGAGAAHNVNAALLASVVQTESSGNPHAASRAGARGLMQLMPGTAAQYRLSDRFSPGGNVNAGSAYLSDLLTRYHENLVLALAAYNAGPAAVDRYRGLPPFRETQMYVAKVIREFNRRVLASQQHPAQ